MMLLEQEESSDSDDHAYFLKCFSQDHQRIFSYIYSLLHNRADTEDVFQQTSLTLWHKFDDYDREREFLPWACGVAFYKVRNFLRVSGRSRLCFSDDLLKTLADERVAEDHRLNRYGDALDECVQKLNEVDRTLIRRAYSGDETVKELSVSLEKAVQTLYNRLNKIRRKLAECVNHRIALQR